MFKNCLQFFTICSTVVTLMIPTHASTRTELVDVKPEIEVIEKTVELSNYTYVPTNVTQIKTMTKAPAVELTNEEIELLALVTMAEAEGECEEGQRLVIDTILNRVDSEHFPDTISGVIYQPNQFTSMWNGRVGKCHVKDDICQLIKEELDHRTNNDVIFFSAGDYSQYGTPMFQVDNHYFSSYD